MKIVTFKKQNFYSRFINVKIMKIQDFNTNFLKIKFNNCFIKKMFLKIIKNMKE